MPTKYANASLDPQLVSALKKIHKEKLAPLGLNYSHPAVIRYLVKFHNTQTGINADLVAESFKQWEETESE
jgi:hypothetical protein